VSPLDLAQIVKGPTDSKSSAQRASIVDARIGRAPDGLYGNLIKKAEDPLTHSPFGSARDDIFCLLMQTPDAKQLTRFLAYSRNDEFCSFMPAATAFFFYAGDDIILFTSANDNNLTADGNLNKQSDTFGALATKVPTAKPSWGTKEHKFAFVMNNSRKMNQFCEASNDNIAFVTTLKQAI